MSNILVVDEDMKELAIEYLETRKQEIGALEESLSKNDLSTIATTAHKMKGVAESYGFPELTRLGSEMEKAAKAQSYELTQKILNEIKLYIFTVELKFDRIEAA